MAAAQRLVALHRPPPAAGEQPEPPVEPAASSAGVIAPTRAAASSIASGIPSRRRQTSATAAAFAAVSDEVERRRPGAPGPRTGAPRPTAPTRRSRRPGRSAASDGTAHHPLPVERQPLPAGGQDRPPAGTTSAPYSSELGDRLEQVLTVVEHQQQLLGPQELDERFLQRSAPAAASPRTRRRPPRRTAVGSRTGASSTSHAPSAEPRQHLGRRPAAPGGSCRPRRRPSASPPGRLAKPAGDLRQLALAADERAHLQRQVPRERVQRPQRRRTAPSPTWNTCIGRSRSRSRCSPRSTSAASASHQLGRRLRAQHLPAVADRHQPGRPVHRRAEVVPVPELSPRRCAGPSAPGSASPSATPRPPAPAGRRAPPRPPPTPARTRRRTRRPSSRTPYPPCASTAARSSSSWRASAARIASVVVLPQPRRALDVGEQERHRPRRRHPPPQPATAVPRLLGNTRSRASSPLSPTARDCRWSATRPRLPRTGRVHRITCGCGAG